MKKYFLLLLLFSAATQLDAQVKNSAHGGGAGIYVYNLFQPCSNRKPNAEGAVKVKVERRTTGGGAWAEIGVLQAPESIGHLSAAYHRAQKFQPAKEFIHPEVIQPLWEKYQKFPRWDSLAEFLNERGASLAIGALFVDTTAAKGVSYEYQMTAFGKAGNVIGSKTSNSASYPNTTGYLSSPAMLTAEGNPQEAKIEWKFLSQRRPLFFKVFRKQNFFSDFESVGNFITLSKSDNNDEVILSCTDRAIAENQVYFYYCVAADAWGNETKSSDTVIVKTYNTKDLLLPQYFIAKSLGNGKGVELKWKIVAEQSVSGIEIFKNEKYEGDYKSIGFATGTDTSFVDLGAKPGKVYYYYIQVTDRFQHTTSRSPRTPALFEDLKAPRNIRNLNAQVVNGKVKVSWTTIEKNIAGYYVYRSVSLDTNYALVSNLIPAKDSLTVFIDESNNLSSPYGYSYSVVQENTSHAVSKFSPPFFLESAMKAEGLPPVTQLSVQNVNGRAMITWANMQGVSGVSGYEVYRKDNNAGEFVKQHKFMIGSGTNFFTDSTVKQGNTYDYAVKVVVAGGKTSALSTSVNFNFEFGAPSAPTAFTLVATEKGVQLNWDAGDKDNLKEVKIYRAERGDKDALKLNAVNNSITEYTDMTAQKGKSYFYYLTSTSNQNIESEKGEVKFIALNP